MGLHTDCMRADQETTSLLYTKSFMIRAATHEKCLDNGEGPDATCARAARSFSATPAMCFSYSASLLKISVRREVLKNWKSCRYCGSRSKPSCEVSCVMTAP